MLQRMAWREARKAKQRRLCEQKRGHEYRAIWEGRVLGETRHVAAKCIHCPAVEVFPFTLELPDYDRTFVPIIKRKVY